MAIRRDSVNRTTRTIKLPISAPASVAPGDTIMLSRVKEKKLFHDPADASSPECTVKDANGVSHPDGRAYGDAVFNPGIWKPGDPVFDPSSGDM